MAPNCCLLQGKHLTQLITEQLICSSSFMLLPGCTQPQHTENPTQDHLLLYILCVCHGKRAVLNRAADPQLLHQGLACNSHVFLLHGWNSLNIRHISPVRFGVEGPIQGGGTCRTWQGYSRTQCIHVTGSSERVQKNFKLNFSRSLFCQICHLSFSPPKLQKN